MFVFLAVALAWFSINSVQCNNNTIKLGLIMPITPGESGITYGKTLVNTALLAAQTINNESFIPGYTLDFIVLDTFDTATGTVTAAIQCALVEHCVGVVGAGYSQYSELVQYVVQNYSIPQISPASTASELSDKSQYPTFMRTIPSDNATGRAIAQVIQHFNWQQVGLIVGSDTYSNSFVQTFLEATEPDIPEHVTELKNAYTQVIAIFAQQLEAEEILNETYAQGLMGPGFVWVAGDALESLTLYLCGNLVITPSATANTSLAQQYLQQMSSLDLSTPYNSYTYDAVYTFANTFRKMVMTNTSWEDPHVLLSTLLASNFSGVTGEVTFYPNGDRIPYSYDILVWQEDGQLQTVAKITTNGTFTQLAPIIWSDNSTTVPPDYLYLLQYPPTERVKIIYIVLAAMLLGVVVALIFYIIFSLLCKQKEPIDSLNLNITSLVVNITNVVGGILGCTAVLIIVSGVSETHCIVAPVLMDLSLLMCGGVLTFSTLHDFIAEYKTNTTHNLINTFTAQLILYTVWGLILICNVGGLAGSFANEVPDITKFRIQQNFYENHCNFGEHTIVILPITVGVLFAYAIVANIMKVYINKNAANILRTRKVEILNSILHSALIITLIIGAVYISVTTPTQTQIDIVSLVAAPEFFFLTLCYTMCTIMVVANLSVPCNLYAWYTSTTTPRSDDPSPRNQHVLDSFTYDKANTLEGNPPEPNIPFESGKTLSTASHVFDVTSQRNSINMAEVNNL